MYRKRNGSLGFSFTKFANAAVPNFFASERTMGFDQLTPLRRDMLYSHQLASSNFECLDDKSMYVSGVVDTERLSRNTFKALQKCEVVDDHGKVNTHKIGPRFTHQMAILNVVRQRECVNMLFWWEEECQRFRKLMDEEKQLTVLISEAEEHAAEDEDDGSRRETVDQLKFARERVRMKIRQRPSQRREDTEADADNIMDTFRGQVVNAPTAAMNQETRYKLEELPSYEAIPNPRQ